MNKENRFFCYILLITLTVFTLISCDDNPLEFFKNNNQTPKIEDFDIEIPDSNYYDGNPKAVIITPKKGSSTGTIKIFYNGRETAPVNAGTYTVTFNVAAAGEWRTVRGLTAGTLTIKRGEGAVVERPVLNSRTTNSITVNSAAIPASGQNVEYAINTISSEPTSGWQRGTTFSGLAAETTYWIFARAAGNNNYEAGAVSIPLVVVTLPGNHGTATFEYYWVDEHGSLTTTNGGIVTINRNESLNITAQGTGFTVRMWYLNGVDTGQNGITYSFFSALAGKHTISLFVEKDGKLYNTNIIINVL